MKAPEIPGKIRPLLLTAAGIAAVLAVGEAANLASRALGVMAGAVVIVAVFAACWIVHRFRSLLRLARPARNCEPVPVALTEDRRPARIAA